MQWLGEEDVQAGSQLSLTAKHDTYGISFAWPASSTKLPTGQLDDQSHATNSASSIAGPSARDDNARDAEAGGSTSLSSSSALDISGSIVDGYSHRLGHVHNNSAGCDDKQGSRDWPAGHDSKGVQSRQGGVPLPTSGTRPATAVPLVVRGLLYLLLNPCHGSIVQVRKVCCY